MLNAVHFSAGDQQQRVAEIPFTFTISVLHWTWLITL